MLAGKGIAAILFSLLALKMRGKQATSFRAYDEDVVLPVI